MSGSEDRRTDNQLSVVPGLVSAVLGTIAAALALVFLEGHLLGRLLILVAPTISSGARSAWAVLQPPFARHYRAWRVLTKLVKLGKEVKQGKWGAQTKRKEREIRELEELQEQLFNEKLERIRESLENDQ